jgi:cardiolipin synthase (CMP-forming)
MGGKAKSKRVQCGIDGRRAPTGLVANSYSGRLEAAACLATAERRSIAGAGSSRGRDQVNLPNLITLARILSVPLVVWAITSGEMLIAFLLFVAAGISDAVDGFLAKRFGMTSELGAYLDPLADKVLIVSIYVALGISEAVPRWLVILVVSRDLMIIGAVMLSWLVGKPVEVKPLLVSKLNTAAQIFFAGLVLGSLGLRFNPGWTLPVTMALVAALTLLSVAAYVREWVRHMGSAESG